MPSKPHSAETGQQARRIATLSDLRGAVVGLLNPGALEFSDGDDLVQLGLDSIRIIKLAGVLKRQGARTTFAELIEKPTLEAWWTAIASRLPDTAEIDGEVAEPNEKERFLLTPVQHAY